MKKNIDFIDGFEDAVNSEIFVEEQIEVDSVAGTWTSASTVGSAASTFGGSTMSTVGCAGTASSMSGK
ncbi:thiocillin family RiPP [Streptococcus suis]